MNSYSNILVAIDFLKHNQFVIDKAIALAKLHKANLSVVNVIPMIDFPDKSQVFTNDLFDYLESVQKNQLKFFKSKIDIECDFYLYNGSPKHQILRLAKEINADLIVIGRYGEKISEIPVGSTALAILSASKCDVLMVENHLQNNS